MFASCSYGYAERFVQTLQQECLDKLILSAKNSYGMSSTNTFSTIITSDHTRVSMELSLILGRRKKEVKSWSSKGLEVCSNHTGGSKRLFRVILPFKPHRYWIWRHRGYETPLMDRDLRRYIQQGSPEGSSRFLRRTLMGKVEILGRGLPVHPESLSRV